MKFLSTALLLATGTLALKVNQKQTIHLKQANELVESQKAVSAMWNAAVEANEAKDAKDVPNHFDLVGLAEGLTKTASTAVKVQKLSSHVREAKKTLEQHKRHVVEIEELVKKAEGDQQKELTSVLENAKQHVQELEQTVSKAEVEVDKEVKKEESEKKESAPAAPVAETKVQTEVDAKVELNTHEKAEAKIKELTEKLHLLEHKAQAKQDKMKAIKSEKKLLKKQKELEKTKQQIAQVETELKETTSEMVDSKRDQYSYQPVYENNESKFDGERKSRKADLDKAFEDIAKAKTEKEKTKRLILDTKLETQRTAIRFKAAAPFTNPETNHHPDKNTKYVDARESEMENLANRQRKAKEAVKGVNEENDNLKKALEEQKKLLEETKKNVTEEIRKEKLEEAEKKKKEEEMSLAQGELKAEQNQDAVLKTELDTAHHELKDLKEKYEKLRSQHDAEVKSLFENKHTLKFVKQMKHYKDEWWAKTGDTDRKQIATQMASTTKSWVSASKEQIAAEEKSQ